MRNSHDSNIYRYSEVTFFSFYKRKRRKKLVVSKYFIIFVIKNFISGEYGNQGKEWKYVPS